MVGLWLALAGCAAPEGPGTVWFLPDTAQDFAQGDRGPYGAAWLQTRVQARVVESIDVEVMFPADDRGEPDGDVLPAPAIVLVQGGFVTTERTRWMAAHFASRGYVVLSPDHVNNLALLESDNGLIALDAVIDGDGVFEGLIDADAPAMVGGHSLGGVAAAVQWAQPEGRFAGLFLLGSFAAEGTDLSRHADPILSLVGGNDTSSTPEEVREGWEQFPTERWLGVVEGMNHYGWTDDNSDADLERGGPVGRPDEETRPDGMRPLDAYLDLILRDDMDARTLLEQGSFSG
ncbi:MAG: alpha/beta hydrolase, partial [Myxococcota bacterium]